MVEKAKKYVCVTLFLPRHLVEEAKKLGVKVAAVARQALIKFAERSDLPPMEVRVEEKERVDVTIPRELAKKLKERGGPSAATWFVAKRLEAAVEMARKLSSMSTEEFMAEYFANGGWPVDDFLALDEDALDEDGEASAYPEPERAESCPGTECAPARRIRATEAPRVPAPAGPGAVEGRSRPTQPLAQAIGQVQVVELLGRMFGFVEKLMDEVRRQNDALARAVESLNAAVERLQSPGRTGPSPQEAPRSGTTRGRAAGRSGRSRRARSRGGASRRARAGPTEEDEELESLSRTYDGQPRMFSLMERERIVRKARETLKAVEEESVLPPIERAAVVDGDMLDELVLEPPERAFVSTPEHLARYLRMAEEREAEVKVPDVEGLPSYFQDNPWVSILANRAREAELVDEHGDKGRRFFRELKERGEISGEDYKGAVLLLTATSRMPDFWDRLNDPNFVPDGTWSPEEIERAKEWEPPKTERGWPLRTTWMIHPGSVPTIVEDVPMEIVKRRWEHFKREGRLPSDEEIMEEMEEEEYRLRCRLFGKLRADDWRAIREYQRKVEKEGNPFLKWLEGEDEDEYYEDEF